MSGCDCAGSPPSLPPHNLCTFNPSIAPDPESSLVDIDDGRIGGHRHEAAVGRVLDVRDGLVEVFHVVEGAEVLSLVQDLHAEQRRGDAGEELVDRTRSQLTGVDTARLQLTGLNRARGRLTAIVIWLVPTLTCPLLLPTAMWKPPEPVDEIGFVEMPTARGSHPSAWRRAGRRA